MNLLMESERRFEGVETYCSKYFITTWSVRRLFRIIAPTGIKK